MRRLVLLTLLGVAAACGEPDADPDPECVDVANTAWACVNGTYQLSRGRCVDGRYEVEACGANEWCLPWSDNAETPVEGRCVDHQIDYRCPDDGVCPGRLTCYDGRCRTGCSFAAQHCPIEGQVCGASVELIPGTYQSICIYEDER
jgi:hypothetical protein